MRPTELATLLLSTARRTEFLRYVAVMPIFVAPERSNFTVQIGDLGTDSRREASA